jgi:hypothetical protein
LLAFEEFEWLGRYASKFEPVWRICRVQGMRDQEGVTARLKGRYLGEHIL